MTDASQDNPADYPGDLRPGAMASRRPTTLYLIRHGEPEPEYLNTYYGQDDVPLGAKGLKQSEAVAERLGGLPVDAIYSSDLERAWKLAEMIGARHELPVRRLPVFRERNMGALQGFTREELETRHGEAFRAWQADRVFYRVPEAENFEDLSRRVLPAVRELLASFQGGRIVLVCHAGPIRVVLAEAIGLPLANIFQLAVNHCSIHVVEYPHEAPPRLTLLNG